MSTRKLRALITPDTIPWLSEEDGALIVCIPSRVLFYSSSRGGDATPEEELGLSACEYLSQLYDNPLL